MNAVRGWVLNRIVALVGEDGYATDEGLAGELGLDSSEVRTAVGTLYRRRRLDRADGYLVLPERREPLVAPAESGRAALGDGGLKASACRLRSRRMAQVGVLPRLQAPRPAAGRPDGLGGPVRGPVG